jgi:hypothetical protein
MKLQKRIPGLHQDSVISSVSITDVWEPIEEGLVPLSFTEPLSLLVNCWISLLFLIYVVLLQIGDDSSCFNDLNFLIAKGA